MTAAFLFLISRTKPRLSDIIIEMLDFIRKMFKSRKSEPDVPERPDEGNFRNDEASGLQSGEDINVRSCEVIDIEIIDDELH